MQKSNVPCIKTGDFARLCGTNKRTLFHYDEIGLFHPAYTDEKGYRYYSESQFDVFFTISCLQQLGMSLKEIGTFLEQRSPERVKDLLQQQEQVLWQEEQRIKRLRQVIENKLALVTLKEQLDLGERRAFEAPTENAGTRPDVPETEQVPAFEYYYEEDGHAGKIYIEETPEEYLILSDPVNSSDHEVIIHALCDHIGYCNHENLNAGHPYGAMLTVDSLLANQYDHYAYFFTKVTELPVGAVASVGDIKSAESAAPIGDIKSAGAATPVGDIAPAGATGTARAGITCHIKPAGTYVVVYLKGNYYNCRRTYESLFAWITANHKRIGPYSYKEAIIDEFATPNAQDYLTKISIQIMDDVESDKTEQ